MEKFYSSNLKDNKKIVEKIIFQIPKIKIFLLEGSLGAGKTTLVKQIAKKLGIKETIVSPTFVLWHQYFFDKNMVFNHLDLYRIKVKDILSLGLEKELKKTQNIFFIEWGKKLKNYLKRNNKKFLIIDIKKQKQQRIFIFK